MRYVQKIAIHPGKVLAREISFLSMSQNELAEKVGVSAKLISDIINGKALISADLAISLEDVVGGSSGFWLTLCSNYEAILNNNKRIERAKSDAPKYRDAIKNVYSELVRVNMTTNTKQTYEKIIELQKFFGIVSLDNVPQYSEITFRQNRSKYIDQYSLSAWLRYGDIKATALRNAQKYDSAKLKQCLAVIRAETVKMTNASINNIRETLAKCGVILVTTEYFKHTYTNGASRWLGDNPIIQLSDRGKSDDIVWFTLFHEIGHILKHGKKDRFISFDNGNTDDVKEKEADIFASEQLVPTRLYTEFLADNKNNNITHSSIERFCDASNIGKSALVGRLQHDGYINYKSFNDYKRKVVMNTTTSDLIADCRPS